MARKPHRQARDVGLAVRNHYTLQELRRTHPDIKEWDAPDLDPQDQVRIAAARLRTGDIVDPTTLAHHTEGFWLTPEGMKSARDYIQTSLPRDNSDSMDGNRRIAHLFGEGGLSGL